MEAGQVDKLSTEGPCPAVEFDICVLWKLENKGQGDGVSPDGRREIFQSCRLGTAKFLHLTDEETEAQRDAIPHLWSASQSGQIQVWNPSLWISRPCLVPALHPADHQLPPQVA